MNCYIAAQFFKDGLHVFATTSRTITKVAVGAAGAKAKKVVEEPDPVRDTQLLVTKCCGLNKFVDGQDPDLKPDEEYPEWLWSIHTGKPRAFYDFEYNTKEYWLELRRHKEEQKNLARNSVKFYRPPRRYELKFQSRVKSITEYSRS